VNISAPPGSTSSQAERTCDSVMRNDIPEGQFCWVDLATADQRAAKSFYQGLFGWTVRDQRVDEGQFSTFAQREAPFASLYQLTRKQIEHGVPSHWTPYVRVSDVDAAASQASGLGGQIVVPPQDVAGFARIGMISDPTGALIGLWQGPGKTNG
jgi:predicted enzyme related to lactoylglutathione lyase